MGNNPDSKLRPSSFSFQGPFLPTQQKRSPAVNKMLMKVVRKIEEEKYFSSNNSTTFVPKYVTLEPEPQPTLADVNRMSLDRGHKFYGDSREGSVANLDKTIEHYDSNSKAPTKPSSQNSLVDKSLGKNGTKENKAVNLTKPRTSITKTNDPGLPGFINAPRGADPRSQKFFPSQNKINTMKSMNKTQSKGGIPESNAKTFMKANSNAERTGLSQINPNKANIQSLMSPSNIVEEEQEGIHVGSNLEKIVVKKLYVNCNLEKKIFTLPQKIQFELLLYLIDDYMDLILVSPVWYYKINEILETYLLGLDNAFIKTYMSILAFKRSYFSIAPYTFSNRIGFRMDRNIVAEVLDNLIGKSIVISFTFELHKRKGVQYKANYKFDIVRRGNRTIWIHKEENKATAEDSKHVFVQPIMPVCAHDNIKIALNFYNLGGLVNVDTIEWKAPIVEAIPNIPKELQSNFLHGIDKNRICEIEELSDEWVSYKYFENKNKIQYDMFEPQLTLVDTKCSGVDAITMRSQYIANATGEVKTAFQRLGINIFVVGPNDEIVTEVKRLGLSHDLENFVQLRPGDRFVLYLTK